MKMKKVIFHISCFCNLTFMHQEFKINIDCTGFSEEAIALHMTRAEQILNAIELKAVEKGESFSSSEGK